MLELSRSHKVSMKKKKRKVARARAKEVLGSLPRQGQANAANMWQ